jgi:hypothetical protein
MKALVKHAPGDGNVDILDVQEPSCGENQAKMEVAYCVVCGTDIHVLHDTFRNYPPAILRHEFAGTVVEVGRQVSGVQVGDKVTGLGATAVTCSRPWTWQPCVPPSRDATREAPKRESNLNPTESCVPRTLLGKDTALHLSFLDTTAIGVARPPPHSPANTRFRSYTPWSNQPLML